VGQRFVNSIRFLCATDASTGEQSAKEEEKIAAREIQLEKATTRRNSISEIAVAANRNFNSRCASEERERDTYTHTHTRQCSRVLSIHLAIILGCQFEDNGERILGPRHRTPECAHPWSCLRCNAKLLKIRQEVPIHLLH
jgi:hypothetical protein